MALKDYETFSNDVSVATRGEFSSLHQDILVDGGGWEHVQTLYKELILQFIKDIENSLIEFLLRKE